MCCILIWKKIINRTLITADHQLTKYDSRGKITQSSPGTLKETNYKLPSIFLQYYKERERNSFIPYAYSYWFDDCKFPFMLFTPQVHTSTKKKSERKSFHLHFFYMFTENIPTVFVCRLPFTTIHNFVEFIDLAKWKTKLMNSFFFLQE